MAVKASNFAGILKADQAKSLSQTYCSPASIFSPAFPPWPKAATSYPTPIGRVSPNPSDWGCED